jgi:hypothetical protein
MTDQKNTNHFLLIICFLAIYLNMQVWVLGLSLPLKILSSLVSNSVIVMFGLYLKFQGDEKK